MEQCTVTQCNPGMSAPQLVCAHSLWGHTGGLPTRYAQISRPDAASSCAAGLSTVRYALLRQCPNLQLVGHRRLPTCMLLILNLSAPNSHTTPMCALHTQAPMS